MRFTAHIADPERHLRVFNPDSIYLPTKKIGKNNPKAAEIEADNAARQEWNRKADMALLSGIEEAKILEIKRTEIHEKASRSIKSKGWLPSLFRSIIRSLQEEVPKLKTQLAETKGIFKGRERKELETKIRRTEEKISAILEELPEILKEDGYPDVRAFMATYRKAEAVVQQYNRELAEWERKVREKGKPAEKEQAVPPRRESVLKRLRQLQAEGKSQKPKPKRKTHDMER